MIEVESSQFTLKILNNYRSHLKRLKLEVQGFKNVSFQWLSDIVDHKDKLTHYEVRIIVSEIAHPWSERSARAIPYISLERKLKGKAEKSVN